LVTTEQELNLPAATVAAEDAATEGAGDRDDTGAVEVAGLDAATALAEGVVPEDDEWQPVIKRATGTVSPIATTARFGRMGTSYRMTRTGTSDPITLSRVLKVATRD
jgi:hypothetical protein